MSAPPNYTSSTPVHLQRYAAFLRLNLFDELTAHYTDNLKKSSIPLLQLIDTLKTDQLSIRARAGIHKLLFALESGDALDEVKKDLENWKANGIPDIPRSSVSLRDISLIYSTQKLSFQAFLPYYSKDIDVITETITHIELFYQNVIDHALQMLERYQLEEYEKRIELEERYRELFDDASDMIQIVSPEGNILYVNNAFLDNLGFEWEELKNKQIFELIKESELDKFKQYRESMLLGLEPNESIITSYKHKNGKEVVVEGFISCKFKNGKVEYTRGMLRNITMKLEQEKKIGFYLDQLGESEERIRKIIDNAPDGVIVINSNNIIQLWNPKCEKIFGWSKEEAIGKVMSNLITPVHLREAHNAGMKRYLQSKQPHILNTTVEVPAINKANQEFYISLTVSHSTQAGEDVFIAFLRDITVQKRNQLELHQKTIQLEKSNSELEQYAWLTSHDLKEPLRKILTYSDALIKHPEKGVSENQVSYLSKIHQSAYRMKGLIEAVLLYSNVSTDKTLFEETNLSLVLKDVLDDLELLIASKNVNIHYSCLPTIEAIPVQMRQLFQNLLSNAIKYSKPEQTPEISISCTKNNEGYNIVVSDNGVGFENMYAEKIFLIFQKLLSTTTNDGTGIGLALCKKIVEAHKGTIDAESKPGEGATFTIYLPAKQQQATLPVI